MRRIFLAIFVFFCYTGFLSAEVGLGASFSCDISENCPKSAAFSVRSDEMPWCVFFKAGLNQNTVTLVIDNWFINERISDHTDYFVLWGISFGSTFDDGEKALFAASRLGAGLDFFFLRRRIEFFGQCVWEPFYGIEKDPGSDWKPFITLLNFPCSVGLRGWL